MNEIARITLVVTVELESEPGYDTQNGRELGYEYLVVRKVEETSAEVIPGPNPNALAIGYYDDFEELDPDDLLVDAVKTALFGLVPESERPPVERDEYIQLETGE